MELLVKPEMLTSYIYGPTVSALPNVGPYIYDVSISGFTRSATYIYIYIYDISSLRVKFVSTFCAAAMYPTWL